MSTNIQPINPGQTYNVGSREHLIQTQHKYDRVEIVDHFDKGKYPVPVHIVTKIDRNGEIDTDIA